jgi:hypothetical protein
VHSLDFRHFVHCFIPHLQVLYHKSYLLSRDSCLNLLALLYPNIFSSIVFSQKTPNHYT